MSPPRKPPGPRVAKARLVSRTAAAGAIRRPRGGLSQRLTSFNPAALGEPRGFTHGWLAPASARLLFVAGQTAADADGRIARTTMAAQFDAALARVLTVVHAAGGRPEHIVRMTVYVTELDAYLAARKAIGAAWKARMGDRFPAMALVEVTRLVDVGAAVEIEATAALPASNEETRESSRRPRSCTAHDAATGVVTLTLNRPERMNALTFEVYDELRRTFRAARPTSPACGRSC